MALILFYTYDIKPVLPDNRKLSWVRKQALVWFLFRTVQDQPVMIETLDSFRLSFLPELPHAHHPAVLSASPPAAHLGREP